MKRPLPLPLPCLLALACAPASVIVPSSAPVPEASLALPPSASPVPPEPTADPGLSRVESILVAEPLRLEVELVRGDRRRRILTVPVDLDEAVVDYADSD